MVRMCHTDSHYYSLPAKIIQFNFSIIQTVTTQHTVGFVWLVFIVTNRNAYSSLVSVFPALKIKLRLVGRGWLWQNRVLCLPLARYIYVVGRSRRQLCTQLSPCYLHLLLLLKVFIAQNFSNIHLVTKITKLFP
jgi:hypothetical protein